MKISIYSCAVDGSGDYHAALKILPILLKDKTLELTWLVKSQQEPIIQKIFQARLQFPTVNIVHILPKNPAERSLESAEEITVHLPTDTDLIIVLPNVNEMNHLQSFFTQRCKQAKILNISEYDYTPTQQLCHTMGLAQDSIGVLIPETESKPVSNLKPLQKNTGLEGFNMSEPYFFGYSNNTKSSQWDPKQQESFIRSALVIAKKEGHQAIQMVTNIPLDTIHDLKSQLEQQVKQIEYHSSTSNDNSIDYPFSMATATLKIFNPFPLTDPDEFQSLLHHSHPVALCTGDQSLIENIFALKCIFYQVMSWKRGLSQAFVEFVKEICGPHSFYYNFVNTAISQSSSLPLFLEKEWNPEPNQKQEIQKDAQKLIEAIQRKKNFNNFLPILVNLSLLPEEKLDSPDILQKVQTCSQLVIILSAFKKNASKSLRVLQSIQNQLPDIMNTFSDFKKILNAINSTMTKDHSDSRMPLDSMPAKGQLHVSEEQLSILITAILKNLPSIVTKPKQLQELLSLSLTSEHRTQILNALQENLRDLIPSCFDFNDLLKLELLTSKHFSQILSGLQSSLGNWVIYNLTDFFKSFGDQLISEHCTLILEALQAKLETLITYPQQLKDLFELPTKQLTAVHRSQILAMLQAHLNDFFKSTYKIDSFFKLSNKQLTAKHRSYILAQVNLGALIKNVYTLSDLFKLPVEKLTVEHRSQVLYGLQENIGNLIRSIADLRYLFMLSNEKLTSAQRSFILNTLKAKLETLITSFYDLLELLMLSNEHLALENRMLILELPAIHFLIISLNEDEFNQLRTFLPEETVMKILIKRSTNNNDTSQQVNVSKSNPETVNLSKEEGLRSQNPMHDKKRSITEVREAVFAPKKTARTNEKNNTRPTLCVLL